MRIIASIMPKWRFDAANIEIPQDWEVRFVNPASDEELIDACKEAECLLTPPAFQHINANVLKRSSHLKLVQSVGAGFDGVDIQIAAQLGIPVANVPGENARAVAEFTVGMMITMQRSIGIADRETKAGNYTEVRKKLFQQGLSETGGSLVGLVGLGAIGREVARILRCLGSTVSYYSRHRLSPEAETELGIHYKPLQMMLPESDIISLHIPLTEQTRGYIGKKELLLMKPGSYLINTARGAIVQQQALADVLESGHLAGAATDVLEPEPPSADHPLLRLSPSAGDRLLITPHIAGVTVQSFQSMLGKALENIQRVLKGEKPLNVVNELK